MIVLPTTQNVPLTRWDDGSIRIMGSRVTLDVIIHNYKQGSTAEQIVEDFPSLTLSQIHGTIAFYWDNQEEIENYLSERRQEAEEVRRFIESKLNTSVLRERILARRGQLITNLS